MWPCMTVARHAWTLFLPVGLVLALVSVSTLFVDGFDRDNDTLIASFGVGMGLMTIALAAFPLRRGERWAAAVLLYVPVFFVWHIAVLGTWLPDGVFLALSLAGLAPALGRSTAGAAPAQASP